jgi:predicted ATPase
MTWHILTGTPGAGKTAIIRQLECDGYRVVEEAATDVIALEHAAGRTEPENEAEFIARILSLQQQRERRACAQEAEDHRAGPVFFDRSPACTLALSRYLGRPDSPRLTAAVGEMMAGGRYSRTVFFVRNRGVVTPTAARRISFEDSVRFERVHEQVYAELGFRLAEVPPGPLADRVSLICRQAGWSAAASRGRDRDSVTR